ncbi:bifunctional DNA primase/polymerase [Bradyrhizobium sp. 157]|uniref:bifunctional DNA primase/polymerase n=1 Tax=Bradyrhizobium sp. 157 TaxID=2782631 RepID=UPI001FF8B177|nr:bifunctional DNA primase/polymerase [Bradyrhizobium sp. 157]MCK1639099.1 bifunctional DNA primase/polymerase [Bradyrhizobium sp. 157]
MLNIPPHAMATAEAVIIPDFRRAVAAAIKAYKASGQMTDAALAYARFGVPVFPVNARSKNPVAAKLKDEHGNPIDGSGGFKRATTDPVQILQWWPRSRFKKRNEHLIGVPMGMASGVWCADIDTKSGGHANDGLAVWQSLQDKHGAIKTRQHRTASGGLHEIFIWSPSRPITCRRGSVPGGIDVKAEGGYIVVPPSKRKGNDYVVTIDAAPREAPGWLYNLIGEAPAPKLSAIRHDPTKPRNAFQEFGAMTSRFNSTFSLDELAEAMDVIPNNDLEYDDWKNIALALYAATDGSDEGLALLIAFSEKSKKYNRLTTVLTWREIKSSPPSMTGAGKLFKLARGNKTEPTHAAANFTEIENARKTIARHVNNFFNPNIWHKYGDLWSGTGAVEALRIDTGLGKTTAALDAIAASLSRPPAEDEQPVRLIHYVVPTRKLALEIVEKLKARGINARPFFGREADDLERPGDKMCLQLDVVDIAIEAKLDVSKSCCKRGGDVCPMFNECGFQRQGRDTDDVQVWVFANNYLFLRQDVLGTPDLLIIDESFWQKQLRGIDDDERMPLSLTFLGDDPEMRAVGEALKLQPDDGGLQLSYARGAGNFHTLTQLIHQKWHQIEEIQRTLAMRPGMNAAAIKSHMKKNGVRLKRIAYLYSARVLLEELRDMILDGIPVSGRLQLSTDDSVRMIQWRGVADVKDQFRVRTLMLDATLPSIDILRVSHPRVKVRCEIQAALPDAVKIRQVLDAPTSKTKLIDGDAAEKHQHEVLRYILQRWIETGRQKALVISQLDYEEWLKDKLPPQIATAHYNNIAGLDTHGDVRLLILVGRPQPGPVAIETMAATLSGAMPEGVPESENGFDWFSRKRRGIRMRDGSGVAVIGDEHPDPFCEAIRQQICEAELVQALGRARAINRDATSPLDVDLMFDVVLPITVDEVDLWQRPSLCISTAIDGVMLEAPDHMMKLWPELWPNRKAATRSLAKSLPQLPGFERHQYQPKGRNQKWRIAWFDRSLITDPAAWLNDRLGRPVTMRATP